MHSSLVRTPTLCTLLAGESTFKQLLRFATAYRVCISRPLSLTAFPTACLLLFCCCALCLFEVRFVLFASSVWSLAPVAVAVAVASDAARLPLVGDKTLICCNSRIASLVARPVVQIKTMRG